VGEREGRESKTQYETGGGDGIGDGLNTMEGSFAEKGAPIQEPAYKYLQSMSIFTSPNQAMINGIN